MPKWLIAGVGLLLLSTGLITFWLPIPVGVPLLLVGVPIVMKNSPLGRKCILRLVERFPRLARYLERVAGTARDDGNRRK